ncbi:DEKNAAC101578 [Brettanomyces naardenensis]|uniref:DEKNAAC101578 n=1 Tax=Brettanomyces naardenensis TaxID=13370 RepID=A0A448YIE0_BRENA|nr:DEKNAAC101578 [Brettanomyces naardenensis]
MPGFSTRLLYADRKTMDRVPDVVSPINVATTYRYPDKVEDFVMAKDVDPASLTTDRPLYSRLSHPNSSKCEAVLGDIVGGHAVAYNSGLSAFYAAVTYYNPKTVAIGHGYHGVHGILDILTRNYGIKQVRLDQLDQLSKGDVVHIETPENPYSEVHDIAKYVKKAHEIGAYVIVDATFAPPPLQDPWEFDVDMVMHAATKYFGGHSDLLAGVLVTKDPKVKTQLVNDRVFLGTNIANLESFLLLRSLRTYELRIKRQSSNAEKIVAYLDSHRQDYPALKVLHHSSLQKDEYVAKQMKGGHSPVFAIELENEDQAKNFPSKLKYFQHSTSLGGVESLIEWRCLSDPTARPALLRISVGVEDAEDLIGDLDGALKALK